MSEVWGSVTDLVWIAITILGLLSFIFMYHPSSLADWRGTLVSIDRELPSLCREHNGEELPAELTRTGKLRFADECKIIHDGRRRRRRRLYNQRYFISMDLTLPFGR